MDVTKRFGLNHHAWLDPDWGEHKYPVVKVAFRVTVTPGKLNRPGKKHDKPWEFFLLLPEYDEMDLPGVVGAAVEGVVQEGDRYRFTRVDHDDVQNIDDATSMLIFHPLDEEEYFWVVPPTHLRS